MGGGIHTGKGGELSITAHHRGDGWWDTTWQGRGVINHSTPQGRWVTMPLYLFTEQYTTEGIGKVTPAFAWSGNGEKLPSMEPAKIEPTISQMRECVQIAPLHSVHMGNHSLFAGNLGKLAGKEEFEAHYDPRRQNEDKGSCRNSLRLTVYEKMPLKISEALRRRATYFPPAVYVVEETGEDLVCACVEVACACCWLWKRGTFYARRASKPVPRVGSSQHDDRDEAESWSTTDKARKAALDENTFRRVWQKQSVSSRAMGLCVYVGSTTVLRVLHEKCMHLYHVRKFRVLSECDYMPHVTFCEWFRQGNNVRPNFTSTDCTLHRRAHFTRDGRFNRRNSPVWTRANPPHTHLMCNRVRYSVNM
ncbi:hypothetical protein PR048_020830 [Dryococelus australis]|uniref:Uncharacterized protein n=1 Tax=Dryococelus australis TaxID=614101 RepID=A0ABQ9GWI4_9NEOP|nr:hypothetical protein PR048_020830 [Dryococelus australis]